MQPVVNQSLPENPLEVKENPLNPGSSVYRRPLVTTHISQQRGGNFDLELYPLSVKIVRRDASRALKKRGLRKEIFSFSWASKRRLRFTAANASPSLISHFGLTYHNRVPSGKEVKHDLNIFLTSLRRANLSIGYLWILEFQKRGTVHLHLWLTLPVSYSLHQFLAGRWNDIAEPGDDEHFKVHLHEKNFITWEMRSAGYLCKYIDKEHQKRVPDGFRGVGRFWGSSRGLVAIPDVVSDTELWDSFSLLTRKAPSVILRMLCKSQEKKIHKKKFRKFARLTRGNYTWLDARKSFDQIEEYFKNQPPF